MNIRIGKIDITWIEVELKRLETKEETIKRESVQRLERAKCENLNIQIQNNMNICLELINEIEESFTGRECIKSEDRLVTLNIDTEKHDKKPSKSETAAIQKRIGSLKKEVTVKELVKAIEEGRSFKAAALNGNKNLNWESQQVFCIDVDNDERSINKYGMLTPKVAYDRFERLGIAPTFYYESFSSTNEKPKFRLVFLTPEPVYDVRIRNSIQMALMNIMPEGDRACKDLSRLFHGTNKKCELVKFDYRINPYKLIQAMIGYIKENNDNPNDSKIIKNYCSSIGINIINGFPDIRLIEDNENGITNANSIIYTIDSAVSMPKKILFNFNIEKESAYKITIASDGKKRFTKISIQSKKVKYDRLVRKFNFSDLENNCELWADFINGSRWCYHNEIFGIACNMWNVEGAETRMISAINNSNQYEDKYNKINTIKSCSSYGYLPERCANFCPYYKWCPNTGINMLHSIDNKRGSIRKVEDIETITLEEAEVMLQQVILEAYSASNRNVYVIKGVTGIGKTTALMNLNNYNNLCISYPNHRLGTDIVERLNIENSIHIKELELMDKDVYKEFRRLQSIGAYKQARMYLQKYLNTLIANIEQESSNKSEAQIEIENINKYLEAINKCRTANNTVFCTHKRMLELDNRNIETYIIDEDIVLSSLIETIEIKPDTLDALINLASITNAETTKGQLFTIKEKVIEAIKKPGQVFKIPTFFIKEREINAMIEVGKNSIDINLKDLLKTRILTANTNREVLGMSIGKLPNKKCIVLSATANETVYRNLLTDRDIEFIDLGNVETRGKLILHYKSFSRTDIRKNFEKAVKQIRSEAPGIDNVITFAKYKERFKREGFNPIAHFGSCSGLDAYKGQDLIVAGTPHVDERMYFLLAAAIKDNVVTEQGIKYCNVRRNGFEFSFSTYNNASVTETDNLLQEIQFYLIESELIQAIGRARILRTNATVHLFSNYAVQGSELYKAS
ncbi:hypothetical protein PMY12_14620 [Clostridium tertium]|uniref:hypothetical protein n=1 Tax=Clostridium tertium TaxID=1559 RepID=UPI00232D2585|nr:hypothetical protein [Clostridium tertium]MDB1931716.1 hypothetical protein [Clostridium tertium]MDB1938238.1 hypothetical protein [Clostridium tertium]